MVLLAVIFLTFLIFEDAHSSFNYTNCGRQRPGLDAPSIKIVGGTEAKPGEFPWQAALYRYDRRICGATVVHPEWIITAAHCVDVINDPPIFDYLVGSNVLLTYQESPYHQLRETSEVYVHPNYRLESHDFDIVLMRMSEPFDWDDDGYVYPACVPSADMVDNFPPGSDSVITGWGAEEEGGGQSDELNKVTAPITSQTYCNDSYGGSITNNMICAGVPGGGVDSCQGDSGGPMVAKNPDDGLWYLIGVVSWGTGCARPDYPGVYARVTTFADWIEPIFNGGTPEGMPVGQCSDEDFQCEGGFCIPKDFRCDGYRDCYHQTDELYCDSALKPFDVYFDKRLDPFKQDLIEVKADDSNGCGLYCLEEDCHAFDVLPDLDENNQTVCHMVFGMDYIIQKLTLNESTVLGITHFQRGTTTGPGTDFTSALGTILSPAFGELEVDPGLLSYTMNTSEYYYNHITFNFIATKAQNESSSCTDHATQNLVVIRGVAEESGGVFVKCLSEIEVGTDIEIQDEDAVLEFYSHDPSSFGFVVDYRASWYCDTVETMAPGFLVSPRYGIGDYPRNVRCRSLIVAPEGYRVRLEVEFFRIEYDGNTEGYCPRDWDTLSIYDDHTLVGSYCGDLIPREFLSTSTDLSVVFESDSSAQETGYKLNFFFIPALGTSASTEAVTSPKPSSEPGPSSSSAEPTTHPVPTPSDETPSEHQTNWISTLPAEPHSTKKPETTRPEEENTPMRSELSEKDKRIQELEEKSTERMIVIIILAAVIAVVLMFATIIIFKLNAENKVGADSPDGSTNKAYVDDTIETVVHVSTKEKTDF